MADVLFQAFTREFAKQGHRIEKINYTYAIFFSVEPFTESYMGWYQATLYCYTAYDDTPLIDILEEEIISGSSRFRNAICEAIEIMKTEEINIGKQKMKRDRVNRMEWL